MKKTKYVLTLFLTVLFLCIAAPAALADGDPPILRTDSDNECMTQNNAAPTNKTRKLLMNTADTTYDTGSFAVNDLTFIQDQNKKEYVQRMIQYYIDNNENLRNTLDGGKAVIFVFEGGSDIGKIEKDGERSGALCLVVRKEGNDNIIKCYTKNSSTLPDYPLASQYDNGHDGYGSGTLLDGIYPLVTINHRDLYAGYQVRMNETQCATCLYMNDGGFFSVLNGTGIHLHTRVATTVSGDPTGPYCGGGIPVRGGHPFDGYIDFIDQAKPATAELAINTKEQYDGEYIKLFKTPEYEKAGMLVLDRYLARDAMLPVYENNAAVARITAASTAAAEDAKRTDKVLNGCTVYPAYLNIQPAAGTKLSTVPADSGTINDETCNGNEMTAIGLYKNADNQYWYRVLSGSNARFLKASDAGNVTTLYDDITIHSFNYPEKKAYGKPFGIEGIVSGAYNKVESVTAKLFSGDTPDCTASTDYPILASLSLDANDAWVPFEKSIDYNMAFRNLAPGIHTYQVIAHVKNYYVENNEVKCEDKDIELVNKDFPVYTHEISYGKGKVIVTESNHNQAVKTELATELEKLVEQLKEGGLLSSEEMEMVQNGQTLNISLEIKTHNPTQAVKKAMEKAAGGKTIGAFIDISLYKQIGEDAPQPIPDTGKPIKIAIQVPEGLLKQGRTFTIIREHAGQYEELKCDYDKQAGVIYVDSGLFSTYAIAYSDNVPTGVTADPMVQTAAFGCLGLALIGLCMMNWRKDLNQ